jgi:hypothetical protein
VIEYRKWLRTQLMYRNDFHLKVLLVVTYILWAPLTVWNLFRKFAVPVLIVMMFVAVGRIETAIDIQTDKIIDVINSQDDSTGEAIVFEWIREQLEQLGETE